MPLFAKDRLLISSLAAKPFNDTPLTPVHFLACSDETLRRRSDTTFSAAYDSLMP